MASISIDKDLEVAYTEERQSHPFTPSEVRNAIGAYPWWKFGGHDRIFVPCRLGTSDLTLSLGKDTGSEAENTIQGTVFSDPREAELYEPIEKYEGKHRFDPHATWSDEEERNLVRRVARSRRNTKLQRLTGSDIARFEDLLVGLHHVLRLAA